jgi:hypothetical protein
MVNGKKGRVRSKIGSPALHDIKSDWKRWSPAERGAAIAIAAVWVFAMSSLIVVTMA